MKTNSEFNSFLAGSSRKFFKYGLGLSILFAIVAFKIPLYSHLPTIPEYEEEEAFVIDYIPQLVPIKKLTEQPKEIKPIQAPLLAKPVASVEEPPEIVEKTPELAPVAVNVKVTSPSLPTPTASPEVLEFAEIMPEFIGGESALFKYFAQETEYDLRAAEWGISGKVYVRFVINKKGEIVKAEIARGVHPLLDNEALRVVKSMPKWLPGIQNGVKVNVAMVLPVSFVLK